MADTTRYVNTGSTSGGNGTTNDTTGANRAYASLSAWESAEQGTISTGNRHIVECCGTAADTTLCTIAGWTVTDADSLVVRGNRGHAAGFYDGDFEYSTSHYRLEVTGSDSLRVQQHGVLLDGIQAKQRTTNFSSAIDYESQANSDSFSVVNCRVRGSSSTGDGALYMKLQDNDLSVRVQNCIIEDATGDAGIEAKWSNFFTGVTLDISNNTVFDCSTGILITEGTGTTGTLRIRNNAVANCGTDYSRSGTSLTATVTHNASDDLFGTSTKDLSPGTPESSEWPNHFTAPNASAGSINFTVVGGGNLDDGGTTGTGIPTTDILGTTRDGTTPDIGAFEEAGGGPTFTQSVSGSLTPSGALSLTIKFDAGVAGSITPTGALTKRTRTSLAGSVTPAGALTKRIRTSLVGSITPVGALVKKVKVALAGSITGVGMLYVTWKQDVAGSITPSGALSSVHNVGGGADTLYSWWKNRRRSLR